MAISEIVLVIHIGCGVAAMLLGLVALRARKSRGLHTGIGEAYHWLFVVIAATACLLALLDWQRLWWFVPIALGSYAFACLGYVSAKVRWKNWLRWHLGGQGGSYIAMTTALLVVNAGMTAWWAWILPTLLGSPLIAWITREVALGRRPKY